MGKTMEDGVPEMGNRPARSRGALTGFYVAMCVLLVVLVLSMWLWTALDNWCFDAPEAQQRQKDAARQLGMPVEKTLDLGDGVKLELTLVPAGRFRMGSQAGQLDGQGIGYQWVLIRGDLYVGKYEVTQEVWEKVMGTNPSCFKGARNPVDSVSWEDCQEFLSRLNSLTAGQYAFRLPTEAEWEWACRAGMRDRFLSGDTAALLQEYAWYGVNSDKHTHPVGGRQPNAWGLYDTHGNVWEWCGDWHENYAQRWRPKADPMGPRTGARRVLRGGSWRSEAGACRSEARGYDIPGARDSRYGLRVAGTCTMGMSSGLPGQP